MSSTNRLGPVGDVARVLGEQTGPVRRPEHVLGVPAVLPRVLDLGWPAPRCNGASVMSSARSVTRRSVVAALPRAGVSTGNVRPPIGGVAQLVERLHGMQEVEGSIPFASTIPVSVESPRVPATTREKVVVAALWAGAVGLTAVLVHHRYQVGNVSGTDFDLWLHAARAVAARAQPVRREPVRLVRLPADARAAPRAVRAREPGPPLAHVWTALEIAAARGGSGRLRVGGRDDAAFVAPSRAVRVLLDHDAALLAGHDQLVLRPVGRVRARGPGARGRGREPEPARGAGRAHRGRGPDQGVARGRGTGAAPARAGTATKSGHRVPRRGARGADIDHRRRRRQRPQWLRPEQRRRPFAAPGQRVGVGRAEVAVLADRFRVGRSSSRRVCARRSRSSCSRGSSACS